MKLRSKVFFSWLAFEVATLPLAIPAFAAFKDRVSFTIPQHVVVSEIPATKGQSQFLVASNGPFAIVSKGVMSEMNVTVSTRGSVDGTTYGQKSQSPGDSTACNMPNSPAASRIYTAFTKTAAQRGTPEEQSVLITVNYDPLFEPELSIVTMESLASRRVLLALPCSFSGS